MTGWNAQPQGEPSDPSMASWRALAGPTAQPASDSTGPAGRSFTPPPLPTFGLAQPATPTSSAPPPAQQPVHGGWQQPWQDETGQWHYPYAAQQPAQAPPYPEAQQPPVQPEPAQYAFPQPAEVAPAVVAPAPAPAQPQFVAPEELAPVGPPRYAVPVRAARDPRRTTLAAVIVFVSMLLAVWAILGFLGSLSSTLSSIASGNEKLKVQLTTANEGLADLDTKTSNLNQMAADSAGMRVTLVKIDKDMGSMLGGVDDIAASMGEMNTSLATLDGELTQVNEINQSMSDTLASINAGLKSQVASVRAMRKDVVATGEVLGALPPTLRATNARLGHVNGAVNTMGCAGITNNLEVDIKLGPIPNGSAKVYATVVPPGAWGFKPDGVTPC